MGVATTTVIQLSRGGYVWKGLDILCGSVWIQLIEKKKLLTG